MATLKSRKATLSRKSKKLCFQYLKDLRKDGKDYYFARLGGIIQLRLRCAKTGISFSKAVEIGWHNMFYAILRIVEEL